MAIQPDQLQILHYPDPRLRIKTQPIDPITDQVRAVAARMLDLMHQAPGVGLAGPQVGLDWRIFVCNPTLLPDEDFVMINPVLTNPSREQAEAEEGCLSLPEVNASIRRPVAVTIDAIDLDGQGIHLTSDDHPARVWQHEIDHLDAILIIDRMAPIDRMVNRQLLRDLEKQFQEG